MIAFSLRKFFWGLLILSLGALIWANNLGYVSVSFKLSRDWPIVMIAIGLMSVWDALFGRHWWGHKFSSPRRDRLADVAKALEDLEAGRISADEAARRMGK